MTTLLVCLFIGLLLTFLSKFPVGIAQNKAGGYDNAMPRQQQASLSGMGARALAAHKNSFEALLQFAVAVFAVIVTDNINSVAQVCAMLFILMRLAYHAFYLADWDKLRSLVWIISFISTIVLFCQAF